MIHFTGRSKVQSSLYSPKTIGSVRGIPGSIKFQMFRNYGEGNLLGNISSNIAHGACIRSIQQYFCSFWCFYFITMSEMFGAKNLRQEKISWFLTLFRHANSQLGRYFIVPNNAQVHCSVLAMLSISIYHFYYFAER